MGKIPYLGLDTCAANNFAIGQKRSRLNAETFSSHVLPQYAKGHVLMLAYDISWYMLSNLKETFRLLVAHQ
jgi:hypothetical protein